MPGMGLLKRLPPLQTHPWAGRHRAVETAAAVEIEQGSLRRLLLDDFHKLFGKASAKNAPAFPQLPQRRRRRSLTKRCGNRNRKNADTRFRLIPFDGTSRHVSYFDELKKDLGYAAVVQMPEKQVASSHAV